MKIEPSHQPLRATIPPSITPYQFARLVRAGKVVDGRAGGLIFGRSFDEGGICAVFKLGSGYMTRGRMEGGEFALNWEAGTQNLKRIEAMNSGITLRELVSEEEEPPPPLDQVIITSAQPDDRLVYLHWGQVIVNREATSKHLSELVEMNRAPNPFLNCDWKAIFNLDGTEDGII